MQECIHVQACRRHLPPACSAGPEGVILKLLAIMMHLLCIRKRSAPHADVSRPDLSACCSTADPARPYVGAVHS